MCNHLQYHHFFGFEIGKFNNLYNVSINIINVKN